LKKEAVNIVWLKRDLRLTDHAPLHFASIQRIPVVLLYILDTHVLNDAHYDARHWQFVRDSLVDVGRRLKLSNNCINVLQGDTVEILKTIAERYTVVNLLSYQETGLSVTYEIDKSIYKGLKNSKIVWQEFQYNGVARGIKNRENWVQNWYGFMHSELNNFEINSVKTIKLDLPQFDSTYFRNLKIDENFQRGGESRALELLKEFIATRSRNYMQHISKPEQSRTSCSRLSAHIAWGNVSLRQVYQAAYNAKALGNKKNLNAFLSRLRWHDHFIQKFEQEVEMEFVPQNKAYAGISWAKNEAYISAWENGQTGIPMVDACMRCLRQTGYLNFRMRAMLVSFFCHAMLQNWRDGITFLARQFTDFEPGIHYPQFQMQSSVTGINTIRIYNPVKQGKEHDPKGFFVRKWVPELQDFPNDVIHEPWKMNAMERVLYGISTTYPSPVLDFEQSLKIARKELWAAKNSTDVKKAAKEVLAKHTISNRKTQ